MKNSLKILGIIAVVAVIGFSMAACDDGTPKDAVDGTTWNASMEGMNYVLTFNSPNVTRSMTYEGETHTQTGTYSISGNNVTLTFVYEGDDSWSTTGILSGNTLSFENDDGPIFTRQ